jgi:glycosyltransferase involved in cell wall biosynthesis
VGVVHSNFLLNTLGVFVSWIYRRCDLILAQSRGFVRLIRGRAGPSVRVEYLPSWAEEIFVSDLTEPAQEIAYQPNFFTLMFAGNVGEAQDFPSILDAAELLKSQRNIRWVILGDGSAYSWVLAEIQKRKLLDCVLLLGRFPLDRMPSFFLHADALLVTLKDKPIFSITVPGKLQSYLASGKPILAMLNGEGADLVVESGAGLACSAGNSQGLADAALKLACLSKEELIEMGQRGRKKYLQDFERLQLLDKLEYYLKSIK